MKIHEPVLKINKQSSKANYLLSFLSIFVEEFRYLVRGLTAYPLYALLFGALALFTLAYQVPLDFAFKLGPANNADFLYAASFNQRESNGDFGFRWSSAESYLRFPGAGRLPQVSLEVTMQVGGRPANLALPVVEVWADGRKLREVTVGPGAQIYRFDYQPQGQRLRGDLIFTLKTPSAFQTTDHNLPLGVVVTEARLKAGPVNNRPVIPALPHTALLLTGLLIFYLALVRSGWQPLGAARWAALPGVGLAFALAFYRLHLTPITEELFLTMLLAYPLTALGLRTTQLFQSSKFQVQNFKFKSTDSSSPQTTDNPKTFSSQSSVLSPYLKWIGLIFFAVFVVKGAGLNHPAFTTIDHWFRIHQILRFWDNPGEFWRQYYNVSTGQTVTGLSGGSAVLGQWGVSVSLPYSPLFYLLAAPLARIWPTHDPNLLAAVNLLATWLEASSVFLVYIIARLSYRGQWAARAGAIAAAMYGFYPLSYLLFSDGGYNSILAQWLTLLFVALLFRQLTTHNSQLTTLRAAILPATVLGLALLAHTSTLLLLGSLVIVFTLFHAIASRRSITGFQIPAFYLFSVVLGGFGLAFVCYYGWYIIPFVRDSLPALLNKFGNGSIGQDNKLLGTQLLTGFWPQLWEHFRLFPFFLTLFWLVSSFKFQVSRSFQLAARNSKLTTPATTDNPQPTTLFFWAWFVVFLGFSLLDLKVNLLQKHMLFAAPLLCLGSGFALSLLMELSIKYQVSSIKSQVGSNSQQATRNKQLATNRIITTEDTEDSPLLTQNFLTDNQQPTTLKLSVLSPQSSVLILLLAYFIIQGLIIWYGRVYYYILPPGSG